MGAVKVSAKVVPAVVLVLKVAVQFFAASIVSVAFADVPEQSPLQLVNVEPVSGVAVKMTELPAFKLLVHVVPQSIPVGWLIILPLPVLVTVKVWVVGCVVPPLKFAEHVFAASMVKLNGLVVPLQLPLQLVNVPPLAGVAVNLTAAPVV